MKLVSVETPEKSVCKMTFSATAEELETASNAAVSYTHLDVYKRQMQASAYVRFKPDTEERSTYLYRAYTKWCEDTRSSHSMLENLILML